MRVVKKAVWPLVAAVAVACSPAGDDEVPAGDAEGDAAVPAEVPERAPEERLRDWNMSLDSDEHDPAGFQMVTREGGFSVETGPAGIAWRPVDLVEQGDFTASASFTETGSPEGHREAYGIIVGGRNLESPDQRYTYFLVRGDGSYLIKRRDGDSTEEIVDWTASEAVRGLETGGGDAANELAVRVSGDRVEFVANGTVVETLPTEQVEPWGIAGIRVNHNLQVGVADWSVEGAAAGVGTAPGSSSADSAAEGGG